MPTFTPGNVMLQNAKTGAVPKDEGKLVLKDFMTQATVTKLAKYEPMTKPEKEFSYLATGPGAYWVGEGERIQTSKATWLTAKMVSKKLGVILPVSKEFLRYSVSEFFTEMRPAIAEAFAIKFDQAALFGINSPFGAGMSVFERAGSQGNTIARDNSLSLYDQISDLMALVEDADKDPNGFVTIRKFKKNIRNTKDSDGNPIFQDATQATAAQLVGQPLGYVDAKSWDYTKALLLAADWDMTRYGIPQGMEYKISEDATLTTLQDENGDPINLFERDMFALRVTQQVGFMTLADEGFAAMTPDLTP
jgi:HK97 family phage major capsid protein